MVVREIMTDKPACCRPDETLQMAAQKMVEWDCGEIPVTDGQNLLGVITDRDICCRAVAKGLDPARTSVRECMTSPAVIATWDTSVDDCCRIMEQYQIRRIPIVDAAGSCCGIVSQADLAQKGGRVIEHMVREVSEPTEHASNVGGMNGF